MLKQFLSTKFIPFLHCGFFNVKYYENSKRVFQLYDLQYLHMRFGFISMTLCVTLCCWMLLHMGWGRLRSALLDVLWIKAGGFPVISAVSALYFRENIPYIRLCQSHKLHTTSKAFLEITPSNLSLLCWPSK